LEKDLQKQFRISIFIPLTISETWCNNITKVKKTGLEKIVIAFGILSSILS